MSDEREAVLCAFCGEIIPADVLERRHHRHGKYTHCSREHNVARCIRDGFYKAIGQKGNAAQAKHKARYGHVPQYKKRSKAVAKSNKEKPRRRKKSE